ncbi:MAG: hypothetical protein A2681_00130 [Candidatus Liptonbacteria bacterium RIFCSPHIGHO2_01_FULL_56_18b]|nr:MAG: hypothetical protein A2681_00130 [Candidatus Liptonbacteria bacterium RIFCSPHIGHO2_01_FULL_56_18b]
MAGLIQHQSLIEQAARREVVRPKKFYAPLVLDALVVVSAFGLAGAYKGYLAGGAPLGALLAALALFAVLSVLAMLLTKAFRRRLVVLAIEVVALFLPFYDTPVAYPFQFLTLTALAAFIVLVFGEYMGARALDNTIKIQFFRVIQPQLSRLITAMVLCGVILYLPYWGAQGSFLSLENFNRMFDFGIGPVKQFYPEITFTGSFGDFADAMTRLQLKNDARFRLLSPAEQERTIRDTAEQLRVSLSASLKSDISADKPLAVVFYDFLVSMLAQWRETFGNQFLFAWAAMLFLIARSLGVVFYWASAVIAFFVYQALIAANFIRVTGETGVHEVLDYYAPYHNNNGRIDEGRREP